MTPPTRQENRVAEWIGNITMRNSVTAHSRRCSGGVITPPYKMEILLKYARAGNLPGQGVDNYFRFSASCQGNWTSSPVTDCATVSKRFA